MNSSTLSFVDFLRLNAPGNLAIIFLAGVALGMFVWQWSKKFFFIAVILALIFAGSKTGALKDKWPFSAINKDKLSSLVEDKVKQEAVKTAQEELQSAAKTN